MGRTASFFLCILVGLAPLALGSNRPLPWAYNAVLSGVICIIVAGQLVAQRPLLPIRLAIVIPSVALWSIAIGWALIQTADVGTTALAHPNWGILADALGGTVSGHISVNPHATLISVTRLLTYCAVFLCAFVLARDQDNARLMLRAFVVFACLYAIYGLFRYSTASGKIFWFDEAPSTSLSSTFINRNSAATYFGLASCASLALLLRRVRHLLAKLEGYRTPRMMIEALSHDFAGMLGVEIVGFVLLLTTVLLTQSRAGVVSTLFALVLGLVLSLLRMWTSKSGPMTVITFAAIVVAFYAVFEMSGARVTERLIGTQIETEGRVGLLKDTLSALSDNALLGTGLGTFQDIYPLYRTETDAAGLVWDKAHNDYLEGLLGLGLPAGAALLLGILLLTLKCLRGTFERRRGSHFPLIGFIASIVIGVHAFFDFSLQIQAVAISFALLLAIGTRQAVSDRR